MNILSPFDISQEFKAAVRDFTMKVIIKWSMLMTFLCDNLIYGLIPDLSGSQHSRLVKGFATPDLPLISMFLLIC